MEAQDAILDEINPKTTNLVWSCRENGPNAITKNYEPGKMGYIQRGVREIQEWANGTFEGNGIWKSEGDARRLEPRDIKRQQSHYRPEVPRGFQQVMVPRLHENGLGLW